MGLLIFWGGKDRHGCGHWRAGAPAVTYWGEILATILQRSLEFIVSKLPSARLMVQPVSLVIVQPVESLVRAFQLRKLSILLSLT